MWSNVTFLGTYPPISTDSHEWDVDKGDTNKKEMCTLISSFILPDPSVRKRMAK